MEKDIEIPPITAKTITRTTTKISTSNNPNKNSTNPTGELPNDYHIWTIEQVSDWAKGITKYGATIASILKKQNIDGAILDTLTLEKLVLIYQVSGGEAEYLLSAIKQLNPEQIPPTKDTFIGEYLFHQFQELKNNFNIFQSTSKPIQHSTSYAQFYRLLNIQHQVATYENTSYGSFAKYFQKVDENTKIGEEEKLHVYLYGELQKLLKKLNITNSKVCDTHSIKNLQTKGMILLSPDWEIHNNKFPLNQAWLHVVGDTKLSKDFNDSEIGQVIYYAYTILNSSSLKSVTAFLTNGKKICFWRVLLKNNLIDVILIGPFHFQPTSNNSQPEGLLYLLHLIKSDNETIPKDFQDKHNLSDLFVEYEAEGLSSIVYSIKINHTKSILKVYRTKKDQVIEATMIKNIGNIGGIPNIVEEGLLWAVINPFGDLLGIEKGIIDNKIFISLINTLKQVHQNGIIHRDIRPSNIIIPHDKSLSPVIIDWSSSATSDKPTFHEGTLHTASNRVLESMINKTLLTPLPSHDLVSLIKSFIILFIKNANDMVYECNRDPKMILQAWNDIYDLCPRNFKLLLDAAENTNYEELIHLIK